MVDKIINSPSVCMAFFFCLSAAIVGVVENGKPRRPIPADITVEQMVDANAKHWAKANASSRHPKKRKGTKYAGRRQQFRSNAIPTSREHSSRD